MTWIGTLNINKGGVSKSKAIAHLVASAHCDILGLQEIDINEWSAPMFLSGRLWGFRPCWVILTTMLAFFVLLCSVGNL